MCSIIYVCCIKLNKLIIDLMNLIRMVELQNSIVHGRNKDQVKQLRDKFLFSLQSIVVIVQFLELYYNCTSAYANLDALTLFACGILALTKIIWFRIYADNLTCNYSSAMNDYLTIDTEEKRIVMRDHAFWGRVICIIALLIAYVDSVIFIVGHAQISSEEAKANISILGHQAGYAIPSTCTLAHFHITTSSYLVIFALEYIYLVIMCISNHGSDSVFLHIALHVCGQLKILKANFMNFDVTSPKVNERFTALILRHNHLIKMARKLAEIISFVLMVQLFISSMLIIIVGFQFIIALTTSDFGMMSKSFLVLSAFLVQLTLYSVVGDYLKTQMEEVALSVYQSVWYDLPAKITRNIVFIMMWTQFPIKLQAGNFVVVDLGTYMSILKSSVSYLSVLRVMMET
ncbi:odorant receptor 2a-like isoform X1 [Temnothorax longispinosus]|uniref:odorant receptor 2a-like isoform X1 n=1 Tax=Temnothorax longispinosus TaxID=300112 RepID=UPI003A98D033